MYQLELLGQGHLSPSLMDQEFPMLIVVELLRQGFKE